MSPDRSIPRTTATPFRVIRATAPKQACALDAGMMGHPRTDLINRAAQAGHLWLAEEHGRPVGFAAVDSFFERPFLALILVEAAVQRRGVASTILGQLEEIYVPQFWTSTNLSNAPAIALFRSRGYRAMGQLDGLDPGDPEVFFQVQTNERTAA